jgi:cytoskeleton protein RodZ
MPEIGATLREARMRERIDIAEVETATKIRAKYLRALENEEWDLLPGTTFIKTFLRTYGDYLGIDSKMLVEEYKQRFERVSPSELMPFQGPLSGRRQPRRPFAIPPFLIVGVVVMGLLGILYALGTADPEEEAGEPNRVATPVPTATPEKPARKKRANQGTVPSVARLRIEATGIVNVCLVDATGRVLIRSENLAAGTRTRTFRSKRFRVTFGNEFARVRVNGKAFKVPRSREAIGYEITSKRRRVLPAAQRPTCVS